MRIALFGPPGVGKGTQASLLVAEYGLLHISTGMMIRSAIAADTPLGREARTYVDGGRLVPGPVVRRMAEEAIASEGYDDFILDGYPRTLEQAEWLSTFLDEHHAPLQAVISLQVDPDVIVDRLSKRRVHKVTGENYHLDFNPPPSDIDPSLIVQRQDDQPDAIRERLEEYRMKTLPVERFYRQQGCLVPVDGEGEIQEVHERIHAVLDRVAV